MFMFRGAPFWENAITKATLSVDPSKSHSGGIGGSKNTFVISAKSKYCKL